MERDASGRRIHAYIALFRQCNDNSSHSLPRHSLPFFRARGGRKSKTQARRLGLGLVAGVGFEPATFGL